MHLREVVSTAVRNIGVVRRVRKLFDCPRVPKGCFNAYVLSSLKYCASAWLSSAESHWCLLHSIVRIMERLWKCELCCLRCIRKVSALCLLYKIYHRVDHPMNEYLKHLVVARSTKAPTTLGELALVTPRCKTDQFSRSFLPAAVRVWNV